MICSSSAIPRSGAKRSRVGGEVLAGEARMVGAEVLVGVLDGAGEEARAERRPGHEADPQLGEHGQELALGVAGPERVLGLDGGERVHLVGGEDLLGAHVAETEVAGLALPHERGHRADGLLDRDARVGEVQVPEVHVVGAEAAQARLERLAGALRPRVDANLLLMVVIEDTAALEHDAPLGRELELVAAGGERAADERLVAAVGVGVGGVDEGRAGVDGVLERGERPARRRCRRTCRGRGPWRRSRSSKS